MIKVKSDCRGMSSEEIFGKILEDRNIDIDFLDPTEENLLPLDSLENIDKAYGVVSDAVNNGENILVFADVDVDGVTSSAIIYRYLRHFTDRISCDINPRKIHGIKNYDLTKLEKIDLMIIVDSINDAEDYQKILDSGTKIVVLDHHIIPNGVKETGIVLVSSADDYENSSLSGAGVCWKFCKYYDEQTLFDYADELADLAVCGIVADMCSMSSLENRYICNLGFRYPTNLGIKKINGTYEFNAQAVSFGIASLVNAAVRTHHTKDALDVFITDDEQEIKVIVKRLKSYKEEQNDEVANIIPDCQAQYEAQKDNKVLVFKHDSNYDVSGLIGNKLLEMYQKPLFVGKQQEGVFAGSARAVGVENFKEIVDKTGLAKTGGHESAFGVEFSDEDKIIEKLNELLSEVEFTDDKIADIQIEAEQISFALIAKLKYINRISGTDFKPISVYIDGITDYNVTTMSSGKHLKLDCGDFAAIKWNYSGDIEDFDNSIFPKLVSVMGTLDSNFFGKKRTNQVIISDFEVNDITEAGG